MSDRIIDRIAKVLALAKGSNIEGEADAAMKLAQDMMRQYNLDMATVEAAKGQGSGEQRAKDWGDKSFLYKWKRQLFTAIAEVNFCLLIIEEQRTKSGEKLAKGYTLIGRQSNVMVSKHMFDYLCAAIERVLIQEVGHSPQARYNRFSHNFRQGCAQRLEHRLRDRHREALRSQAATAKEHAQQAGGTAVALADFGQSETDHNNDIKMGWKAGTTTQQRLDREQKMREGQTQRNQRYSEAKVAYPDADPYVWHLLSYGYSHEMAKVVAAEMRRDEAKARAKAERPETDNQRRKREAKEERERARRDRQYDRETAYTRSEGFLRGKLRGDDIGLDEQVDEDEGRGLLT